MEYEYFNKPTQVCFKDFDNEVNWGIAYCDEIICACCGSIFEVGEVEIVKVYPWIDFTEGIRE